MKYLVLLAFTSFLFSSCAKKSSDAGFHNCDFSTKTITASSDGLATYTIVYKDPSKVTSVTYKGENSDVTVQNPNSHFKATANIKAGGQVGISATTGTVNSILISITYAFLPNGSITAQTNNVSCGY